MNIDWEYPIFFWLIISVAVLALLPRRSRWFLRVAAVAPLARASQKFQGRIIFKKRLPYFLLVGGLILLIIAAADPISGKKQLQSRYLVHTYMIIDDGSGSMTDESRPQGVGERLAALLAANRAFLEEIEKAERPLNETDAVGAVLFSSDAFVLAYPDTNYGNLRRKLEMVDWMVKPLNMGTELNQALWAAIRVIVQRNQQAGGQFFTAEELANLQTNLSGPGRAFNLSPSFRKKIEAIAAEIQGTSFIIFTDGQFNLEPYSSLYYSAKRSNAQLSTAKNILFCQQLGIRVYLIAAETSMSAGVIPLIKKTGGQFRFLKKAGDVAALRTAYLDILRQQANELVVEDRTVKISHYFWPALAGFVLIYLGILVKNTVSCSLTDSY